MRFLVILVALLVSVNAQAQNIRHHHARHHGAQHGKHAHAQHHRAHRGAPQRVAAVLNSRATDPDAEPSLISQAALIIEQDSGKVVFGKNTDMVQPIASLTKLMTALVVLESKQSLDELITIADEDVDVLKNSHSRLPVGTTLTRAAMLKLALMASENRAAAALGRNFPGGTPAFVATMNRQAASLGLTRTQFADPTGLNSGNVSTAHDLAIIAQAAYQHPLIRLYTTSTDMQVNVANRDYPVSFTNTNALVRKGEWDIGLSKTGFINESGRCLVMQARIADRPLVMVLLDSWGKYSRLGDASRIRRWFEETHRRLVAEAS